jgi:hypothetical protein
LASESHSAEQVLAALADNAKHNQTGRVDEHGAIRHAQVELCPVGALACLFFAHFHILGCAPPNFAPDFSNKDYGEYGHRKWYEYHVFYTSCPTKEMTYESEWLADAAMQQPLMGDRRCRPS